MCCSLLPSTWICQGKSRVGGLAPITRWRSHALSLDSQTPTCQVTDFGLRRNGEWSAYYILNRVECWWLIYIALYSPHPQNADWFETSRDCRPIHLVAFQEPHVPTILWSGMQSSLDQVSNTPCGYTDSGDVCLFTDPMYHHHHHYSIYCSRHTLWGWYIQIDTHIWRIISQQATNSQIPFKNVPPQRIRKWRIVLGYLAESMVTYIRCGGHLDECAESIARSQS
jgi:hypothetical protein